VINAPADYFQLLEKDVSGQYADKNEVPDLVHLFVKNNREFQKEMIGLEKWISKNPKIVLWVSWYKKSAKIPTDLTEDIIRNYALGNGLVDVKVCAVSETWSGLKLVVPLARR
ncbi:MAG TPA: hypothetical protein VGD17_12500, partial [Chitinophagaceae bacterium]